MLCWLPRKLHWSRIKPDNLISSQSHANIFADKIIIIIFLFRVHGYRRRLDLVSWPWLRTWLRTECLRSNSDQCIKMSWRQPRCIVVWERVLNTLVVVVRRYEAQENIENKAHQVWYLVAINACDWWSNWPHSNNIISRFCRTVWKLLTFERHNVLEAFLVPKTFFLIIYQVPDVFQSWKEEAGSLSSPSFILHMGLEEKWKVLTCISAAGQDMELGVWESGNEWTEWIFLPPDSAFLSYPCSTGQAYSPLPVLTQRDLAKFPSSIAPSCVNWTVGVCGWLAKTVHTFGRACAL